VSAIEYRLTLDALDESRATFVARFGDTVDRAVLTVPRDGWETSGRPTVVSAILADPLAEASR
jgi:hypothetical protein